MAYIEDRIVHDADSHVMELPHWLDEFGAHETAAAFNARFGHAETLREMAAQHERPDYRRRTANASIGRTSRT